MFGRAWYVGIFMLIGVHSAFPGQDPLANVLNGSATLNQIYGANGQFYREKCLRIQCVAMDDIAQSYEILGDRDTPGGPSLVDPKLFNPDDYNEKVKHLLAAHPDRHPLYCRILRKIARHYDSHSEDVVGRWTMEIAALISSACARSVVAALPHTKAVDDLLSYARGRCLAGSEPGCRFMVRARSQ